MAAQQQQPGQGDNSLSFLWGIVGVFAISYFIWKFFQGAIVTFMFKIKLFEIAVVSLFTSSLKGVQQVIYNLAGTPEDVEFNEIVEISSAIGNVIDIPILIFLLLLAVLVFYSNPIMEFRKKYTMQRLKNLEKGNWPQIHPTIKLDLIKEQIDKGPWAMMYTPMQFCRRNKLLDIEDTQQTVMTSTGLKHRPKAKLIREKAGQLLALQLGNQWSSVADLPIYIQALCGAFAAFAKHKREESNKLFKQISRSAESGKLDFTGAKALAKKYTNDEVLQRVVHQHAYIYTVMSTLLVLARTDGVVASADFLWLKPVDRTLWLVLNSVGRQTPPVEIAGIHGHWLAELDLGRKLYVPMVQTAVDALDEAIENIIYIPDDRLQ